MLRVGGEQHDGIEDHENTNDELCENLHTLEPFTKHAELLRMQKPPQKCQEKGETHDDTKREADPWETDERRANDILLGFVGDDMEDMLWRQWLYIAVLSNEF